MKPTKSGRKNPEIGRKQKPKVSRMARYKNFPKSTAFLY
jgi:hypothetical protein